VYKRQVQAVNKVVQTENNPVLRRRLPETYQRRLTPLQARLVARQLDRVDRDTAARLAHARLYHDGLSGLPGVGLPPLREDGSHVYLAFPLRVPERWDVVKYMMRHRRDLAVQHYTNTADLPCFAEYTRDCPSARRTAAEVILLPTYPGYARAEVERNIATLRRYFGTSMEATQEGVLQRL
jgi:dTDP-4-amino-4,6-dideoxygalactose transaminase